MLQDNVALIAVLEALDPPQLEGSNRRQLICVANTHIHANPELNDVKLWQVCPVLCCQTCMTVGCISPESDLHLNVVHDHQ